MRQEMAFMMTPFAMINAIISKLRSAAKRLPDGGLLCEHVCPNS